MSQRRARRRRPAALTILRCICLGLIKRCVTPRVPRTRNCHALLRSWKELEFFRLPQNQINDRLGLYEQGTYGSVNDGSRSSPLAQGAPSHLSGLTSGKVAKS
jgi:hypothetical protein